MTDFSLEKFLKEYNAADYLRPNFSFDNVIYTVQKNTLYVLLVKRAEHPFLGEWSLVGGFIDVKNDVNLEAAAMRKLKEKTGVCTPYLEQFETIGNNMRDPRGWSVSTAYFALIPFQEISYVYGNDVQDIKWSEVVEGEVSETLAFDHAQILLRCTTRLRAKVLYTSLPIYLLPECFTLGELQRVYETILGHKIDAKSFRRRMLSADILDPVNEMRYESKRPAQLYRAKKQEGSHFFRRNMEKFF